MLERAYPDEALPAKMYGRLGWIVSVTAFVNQLLLVPLLRLRVNRSSMRPVRSSARTSDGPSFTRWRASDRRRHQCCVLMIVMATNSDPYTEPPFEGPADLLRPGHRTLEALFLHLIAVLRSGATDVVESVWSAAERSLVAHLEDEEKTLLAEFLAVRPRDARTLLQEHAHLRRRLSQLRTTLPGLSAGDARTFFDELRAHASHEEAVLYRWAETRRAERARES